MSRKRFWTDYPRPGATYDGKWRVVRPMRYDGDKYVKMWNGEELKRGYLHHGKPMGPRVSHNYATRFFVGGHYGQA
jgi:hypothetical protein